MTDFLRGWFRTDPAGVTMVVCAVAAPMAGIAAAALTKWALA